ncbi:MAG: iron-sulfur cluster assembly scaffold protein [Novosphingobium sp.]|nr:iron-sulfur cluster assembly scaffold protein [Novosphingobium sp.]
MKVPPEPPEAPRKVLYSPEILAAAVALADFPIDPGLPLSGEARSRSCGSTLSLAIELDSEGRIGRVGCKAQACAVGQAAAHVFLAAAPGRAADEITEARQSLAAWLTDDGPSPNWPGIALLDPARDYPARHGAILLAWDAALAALASPMPIR